MSYAIDQLETTVERQQEDTLDQSGTQTVVRRFTGLRADIDILAAGFPGYPKSIAQVGDSPLAELSVTMAGGSVVVEAPISIEWNRRTASSTAPLSERPRYKDKLAALSQETLQLIEKMASGQEDSNAFVPTDPDIQRYLKKRLAGESQFLRPDPQFQYVARYHRGSSFQPDQGYVGVVYPKSTLVSALGIPGDISSGMLAGEYLCEELDFSASSDGSRTLQMTFRWALVWDEDYTHA